MNGGSWPEGVQPLLWAQSDHALSGLGVAQMKNGFSHVGLSTHDMEATIDFYQKTLGFACTADNQISVEEGGHLRQVIFDIGAGEFIAFMESHDVTDIPKDYDTGINEALGVPNMFYHFAFSVETPEALTAKRNELIAKGVRVSSLVHHGPGKSFYVKDPNQIQLEFTASMRELDANDSTGSFTIRRAMLDPED